MKGYVYLLAAIILETIGTTALNKSEQFSKITPTAIMILSYILSFYLVSFATKTIPIGIAYAIWSAVGIVLITIIGAISFKQTPDLPAIIGILLIISGVLVINLLSKMNVH